MTKKHFISFKYVLFLFTLILLGCSIDNQKKDKTDPLLKLWYKQPAQKWTEALPVGNGRIGAMVFGGTDTAQIQLNDATLWSGHPQDGNNPQARKVLPKVRKALFDGDFQQADQLSKQMMGPYVATYLTLGSLFLDFQNDEDSIAHYERQLDLNSAVASVSYQKGKVRFTREIFSSYPDRVLIIHLKANQKNALSFSTRFKNTLPHTTVVTKNSS